MKTHLELSVDLLLGWFSRNSTRLVLTLLMAANVIYLLGGDSPAQAICWKVVQNGSSCTECGRPPDTCKNSKCVPGDWFTGSHFCNGGTGLSIRVSTATFPGCDVVSSGQSGNGCTTLNQPSTTCVRSGCDCTPQNCGVNPTPGGTGKICLGAVSNGGYYGIVSAISEFRRCASE